MSQGETRSALTWRLDWPSRPALENQPVWCAGNNETYSRAFRAMAALQILSTPRGVDAAWALP